MSLAEAQQSTDVGAFLGTLALLAAIGLFIAAAIFGFAHLSTRGSVVHQHSGAIRHDVTGTIQHQVSGVVQHQHLHLGQVQHVHQLDQADRDRLDQFAWQQELERGLADLQRTTATQAHLAQAQQRIIDATPVVYRPGSWREKAALEAHTALQIER